jgi:hypothetical protein
VTPSVARRNFPAPPFPEPPVPTPTSSTTSTPSAGAGISDLVGEVTGLLGGGGTGGGSLRA